MTVLEHEVLKENSTEDLTEVLRGKYKIKTLNLLVVDDEPYMCLACQKSLRHFQVTIDSVSTIVNYQIDVAYSGKDFYDLYASKSYHLILLDYKLPDASGIDLLSHILGQNKAGELHVTPLVIMITAYATFETAVSATKLGAYDFIAKPFTPDELKSSIKKATIRSILEEHARYFEEEKKKVRFQFLSVLAHELKAPINAIEGYLKIIQDKKERLPKEELFYIIERTIIRSQGMRKLIFDLLDLTRIESGEKKRNLEHENLSEVLRKNIGNFELEIKNKNICLETEIESDIYYHFDTSEMDIIFTNLISNAIKYNKDGGKVIIKIEKKKEQPIILVEFTDTGIGIETEDQKRLFQDFIRIKNEYTLKVEGSGLGLSTVKKIIDLYKGKIELKSTWGQGSSFSLFLPYDENC